MMEILLTQNQVTTVDDEDFEFLSRIKWSAYRVTGRGKTGKDYYYGFKAGIKRKPSVSISLETPAYLCLS